MPRSAQYSARELGSRAARQRLPIQREPYFAHVRDKLSVGYRRGARGGTWIARTTDKEHGYRFSSLGTANDLSESVGMSFQAAQDAAQRWQEELVRLDSGEIVSGPYTVAQAMEDYLRDSERTKRKSLYRTRVLVKAHILPTLGKLEISKLTHSRVSKWHDTLAETAPRLRVKAGKPQAYMAHDPSDSDSVRKRQASANRILTVLKAAMNYAHDETKRVATKAAWEGVKPFRKVDVAKIRFMTREEVTALLNNCAEDFSLIVRGALKTGCRYGELAAMRVQDYDIQNETIFIPVSKNGESRHVELNADGASFFAELSKGKSAKTFMFVRSNGKEWKESEQKRPMDAACEAAKIEQVTFHILRHTYASHLAMNATPMKVIADQLGHKDTRITERHYAHLGRAYVRETIRMNLPSFGI